MEFNTNEIINVNDVKKILDHIDFDNMIVNLQKTITGTYPLPKSLSSQEAKDLIDIFSWICELESQVIKEIISTFLSTYSSSNDKSNDTIDIHGWFILKIKTTASDFAIKITLGPNFDGNKFIHPIKNIINTDKRTKQRFLILFMSYVFYEEFHYPQPETGVYDIANNEFEKIKWVYRYWFNQLEVAERDSGLESFFSSQNINIKIKKPPMVTIPPVPPEAWKRSISVSCGGDLLAVDVLTPNNTKYLFDDITDFYSSADIVSANLESTVDDEAEFGRIPVDGKPFKMNTHTSMFDKFRNEAKINFFSTATNHAMDLGKDGILKTLDVLKKSGAYYSGTATSAAEQEDVVIFDKNGLRIALLAFTFDLNGYNLPENESYLVNVVRFNDADPKPDYSLIENQVAIAKAKGADHIIAYCHWGWEFEMYPHVNIVEAAHKVIECGVDTILGNHPHVSQPAQIIERENMPPALVIYAFGDFVSYHPDSRNSKLAYLIKFDIVSHFGSKTSVTNVQALPIYIVNAHLKGDSYDCRIVKFEDVFNNPDNYGLTDLEKSQLPHLYNKVWLEILSPLAKL
ncbi:CapA family protein [Morganella morganii]|uniref:CapA family protein n=1 Tax=Morganella morganii TaxID=582 RepID=UPI0021D0A9CA|nr:CapA family protein [Morganella morganii]MCU6275498.1 CapA family protein [Morganella morganii]